MATFPNSPRLIKGVIVDIDILTPIPSPAGCNRRWQVREESVPNPCA